MSTEAMKLAKAWFERNTYGDEAVDVYEALCEALAQPQQEPVACKDCGAVIKDGVVKCVRGRSCWVGQQPAQRKPLTDDDIRRIANNAGLEPSEISGEVFYALRCVADEAAHSIKENT